MSCYLPPVSSPWGRDSISFFSHLLSMLYTLDSDNVVIAGDLNARIVGLHDFILGVDTISEQSEHR